MLQPTLSEGHITGPLDAEARLQASCAYGQIVEEEPETGLRRVKHPPVTGEDHKNVGSVIFEFTIDGSLRYASVLQRFIIKSVDPFVIICTGMQRPLEPVAIPGLATTPALYTVDAM